MQNNLQWHQFETPDLMAQEVCTQILTLAEKTIVEQARFKLVLAGGTTPKKVYELLAQNQADWSKWFIYYGDERCLPINHKARNSKMATDTFLNQVAIPKNQIFSIPTELGIEESAALYCPIIEAALPFDLVLLGMGEDGHIASLFPNYHHEELDEVIHKIYFSPKPPAQRITMSSKTLSTAQNVFFLIIGINKRKALMQWRDNKNLPITTVKALKHTQVFLDDAAAGTHIERV